MKSVILLAPLAGSHFSLQAEQLVDCDQAEADRLIEAGNARELLADEPTSMQKARRFDMVAASAKATEIDDKLALPVEPIKSVVDEDADDSDDDGTGEDQKPQAAKRSRPRRKA